MSGLAEQYSPGTPPVIEIATEIWSRAVSCWEIQERIAAFGNVAVTQERLSIKKEIEDLIIEMRRFNHESVEAHALEYLLTNQRFDVELVT